MKNPYADFAFSWGIFLSWLAAVGYFTYTWTLSLPDWAGGGLTGLAISVGAWLFHRVFWMFQDGWADEPVGLSDEDDDTPAVPVA